MPERYVATGLSSAGSRGRAPGRGFVGRSPQKLKTFCFTIFSEARIYLDLDQTLWPILTHDGSKCAESRKDVPIFGVNIFNVVLDTGRQTTIKIIKIKQQFYC